MMPPHQSSFAVIGRPHLYHSLGIEGPYSRPHLAVAVTFWPFTTMASTTSLSTIILLLVGELPLAKAPSFP